MADAGRPTKFESGRNAIVEELLVLAPDAGEALGRYEQIEKALDQHAKELVAAITAARLAIGAINVDLQMLRDETKGNTAELERRLEAIGEGAEYLGYPYSATLRVVQPLTSEIEP